MNVIQRGNPVESFRENNVVYFTEIHYYPAIPGVNDGERGEIERDTEDYNGEKGYEAELPLCGRILEIHGERGYLRSFGSPTSESPVRAWPMRRKPP
jgi:hypothetical protein